MWRSGPVAARCPRRRAASGCSRSPGRRTGCAGDRGVRCPGGARSRCSGPRGAASPLCRRAYPLAGLLSECIAVAAASAAAVVATAVASAASAASVGATVVAPAAAAVVTAAAFAPSAAAAVVMAAASAPSVAAAVAIAAALAALAASAAAVVAAAAAAAADFGPWCPGRRGTGLGSPPKALRNPRLRTGGCRRREESFGVVGLRRARARRECTTGSPRALGWISLSRGLRSGGGRFAVDRSVFAREGREGIEAGYMSGGSLLRGFRVDAAPEP